MQPIPKCMLIYNIKYIKYSDTNNGWGMEQSFPKPIDFAVAPEINNVYITSVETIAVNDNVKIRQSSTRLFIDKRNSRPRNYKNISIDENDFILFEDKVYVVKAPLHIAFNQHHWEIEIEVV